MTTQDTASSPPVDLAAPKRKSRGLWAEAGRDLVTRRRSGQVGLVTIIFLILVAVFAPVIATHDPNEVLIGKEDVRRRSPPCIHAANSLPSWPVIRWFQCDPEDPEHYFGVDGNVRDLYSRVVYGARVSLKAGLYTVIIAVLFGTTIGAIAGYMGKGVDNVTMRLMDVVLAFPALILAIAINVALLQMPEESFVARGIASLQSILGFEDVGLLTALIAISIVYIPTYARLTRSQVLSLKEQEFVTAARSVGSKPNRILFRSILPNATSPLIVQATLGIATAILDTAALSFLGLGAQPPTPEWGAMIGAERNQMFTAPHLIFFPGMAILITVLGFNLLGDGLRDALDPRMKNR
ncbi:MAG: ABC transporter permease [Chloroflexota bacterium]|nr:ABC transporter permease [Chloroflexota bacterium]